MLVWPHPWVWKGLPWEDGRINLAAYSLDDRSLIWICSGWQEDKLDLLCVAVFCRSWKFHDTELLFGRLRVSIHDFPAIPRRIDANVTGVTEQEWYNSANRNKGQLWQHFLRRKKSVSEFRLRDWMTCKERRPLEAQAAYYRKTLVSR